MTAGDDLYYSKLMPEVEVLEFLDTLSNSMFSIMLDIDDRTRRVKILMKKNIFLSENLVKTKLEEVQPWEHSENKPEGGFKISYSNQDNDLDTKSDYKIDGTVTLNLPTPTEEGIIYHRNYDNNDYITVADGETLSWQRIGKLKDYSEGNASDGIEIDFKIPALVYGENAMYFPQVVVKYLPKVMEFANLEEIYVSLYRGMIDDVNVVLYPTITDVQTSDSGTTLTPEYLFNACHKDFLRWKAFDARKFTKYFRMTLPEVMALKWDKRYLVNGVEIIIERINFDLPYDGIVQIDGYTGKTPS
jgi:hypothetical protein